MLREKQFHSIPLIEKYRQAEARLTIAFQLKKLRGKSQTRRQFFNDLIMSLNSKYEKTQQEANKTELESG